MGVEKGQELIEAEVAVNQQKIRGRVEIRRRNNT